MGKASKASRTDSTWFVRRVLVIAVVVIAAVPLVGCTGNRDAGIRTHVAADRADSGELDSSVVVKMGKAVALEDAVILHSELIGRSLKVVKGISPQADHFSEEQLYAIYLLGDFRSVQACPALIKVLHVQRAPRVESGLWADGGLHAIPTKTPLDDLPAGQALVDIGSPSVEAIIEAIEWRDVLEEKDLKLYAWILVTILGSDHVRAYLMEEKTHAPESAEARWNKLLALPILNPKDSGSTWKRLGRAEMKRFYQKMGADPEEEMAQ